MLWTLTCERQVLLDFLLVCTNFVPVTFMRNYTALLNSLDLLSDKLSNFQTF